jgi:hypothetical protein
MHPDHGGDRALCEIAADEIAPMICAERNES